MLIGRSSVKLPLAVAWPSDSAVTEAVDWTARLDDMFAQSRGAEPSIRSAYPSSVSLPFIRESK